MTAIVEAGAKESVTDEMMFHLCEALGGFAEFVAPSSTTQAKAKFEEYTADDVTFYIFPYDDWNADTLAARLCGGALRGGRCSGRRCGVQSGAATCAVACAE